MAAVVVQVFRWSHGRGSGLRGHRPASGGDRLSVHCRPPALAERSDLDVVRPSSGRERHPAEMRDQDASPCPESVLANQGGNPVTGDDSVPDGKETVTIHPNRSCNGFSARPPGRQCVKSERR